MTRSRWVVCTRAVFAVAVLFSAGSVALADAEETLQRATDEVITEIANQLRRMNVEKVKNVAVVPLRGDVNDYVTTALKSAVTKTSYGLFTREDDVWKALLAEIEWGVRREDIMDARTVQRFGKIQGVDAILFGVVWDRSVNLWSIRGHVKVTVHLADVETGQILWSSEAVEGESFIHWSDAIMQFWRYPLLLIGAVVLLVVVLVIVRKTLKAIRHATRPL